MQFAVGLELFPSSGENLMAVSLMAYIPYDAVFRGVEDIVQSHRNLHHTQAGSQMTGVHRKLLHDVLAQFIAELWQFIHR